MIDGKNGIMNKMKYLQKIIFINENSLNVTVVFLYYQKRFENIRQKSNVLYFLPSHRSANYTF